MILPIIGYGHPTLSKIAQPIASDYPELSILIDNMFETMYAASGVGLAAPQVGLSIRLLVIDASPFAETYPETKDFKTVLINPEILSEEGELWTFQEGCLSLPNLSENVLRKETIHIRYHDRDFNLIEETFSGVKARVVQHEYDHLEGKVFTDRLTPLKRTVLKRKLNDIAVGKVTPAYKFKPAKPKLR